MKFVSKVFGTVIAILLISLHFANACEAAKPWKLSHQRPPASPLDLDAQFFADGVKKGTGGKVNISIFPANQLGDYSIVQERVSLGDVEVMFGTPSSTVDKKLSLTTMPYMVTNWDELEYLWKKDGAARKIVEEILDKQDIYPLAVWPALCSGIGLTKMPKEPKNPNVPKNMKIRVMPIKVSELTGEALGYIATPLPFGDVFTGLQTGMIEGVIGTGPEGNWSNYRDLIKVYVDERIFYEPFFLMINKQLWLKLSSSEREAIAKVASEMENRRWKAAPKEHDEYIEKLRKNGTQIITFSQEELNVVRDKVVKEVWPKIPAAEFPKEIQKTIRDALKNRKK